MPLLSLWKSNRLAIEEFNIEQVVATAGDGILLDGSACSQELQAYLAQVPSEKLVGYVDHCLSSRFEKGGLVLQDLVNEFGRRLDYKVTNGRYQGTANAVGYDGIWTSPEGQTIIVEVKTTDAYRISLDTLANYRKKLLTTGVINGDPSILIVVGRQDTGELEAQVRGSRHAWDIRLISAEALVKLVKLKENSDEQETGGKIRSVLRPVEYTRLDRLVDVMFTTVNDVESSLTEEEANVQEVEPKILQSKSTSRGVWEFTDATQLQQKRNQIIKALSSKLNLALIKKSRALYWSADHEHRVACTISKRYTKKGAHPYWYAYHPQWDEFLAEGANGYLVLGCMDLPVAFALPRGQMHGLLSYLNTTELESGRYWHVHVIENAQGSYSLLVPKRSENFDLTPYQLPLTESEYSASNH